VCRRCLDIQLSLRITEEWTYSVRRKSIQSSAVFLRVIFARKLNRPITIPWLREQVAQPGMFCIICPNSVPSKNGVTCSWCLLGTAPGLVFASNHIQALLGGNAIWGRARPCRGASPQAE